MMQGAQNGMQLMPILMLILPIFAVFYFLILQPERKRQKQKEATIAALKKGDRIVTSGGIHGSVAAVEDQVVLVKVAENVKIRFAKSAIAGLSDGPGGTSN